MVENTKLRPWRRGDGYPHTPQDAAFLGHHTPTCSYCGATITPREYEEHVGSGSAATGMWACDRCRGQA
jgi:hypothetical protein